MVMMQMRSDGKDSLAGLLGDVEAYCAECWVNRSCAYFGRGSRSGKSCSGCPANDSYDCTKAAFEDIARRLRGLGVESGNAVEACARGEAVGDE